MNFCRIMCVESCVSHSAIARVGDRLQRSRLGISHGHNYFPTQKVVKDFRKLKRVATALPQRLKNYPRRENAGGPRLTRSIAGETGVDSLAWPAFSHFSSFAAKEIAPPTTIAGFCHLPTPARSMPTSRMFRLVAGDSSISVRIASRSSVTETTGNSTTSAHPSASKHCIARKFWPTRCAVERRQSQ